MAKCESGGAGIRARLCEEAWFQRVWGHMDLPPPGVGDTVEKCRPFVLCLGPLQIVRRAEIRSVILVLLCMLVWIT